MSTITQTLRVALAEDERDTREYLQEILTRLGHEAVAIGTGQQLVELCRASPPDLVITDIRMPDMDGLEAAAAINAEQHTPVIVVSAHHDPALLERAGAAAVMAYLVKPVDPADVEAAVAVAIRRFREYREARQEVFDLRQALEDRKEIERAKGAVVKWLGVDEEEAYRRLRRYASDRNLKLVTVSRAVLESAAIFRELEEAGRRGADSPAARR
jgi:response regulator NasT